MTAVPIYASMINTQSQADLQTLRGTRRMIKVDDDTMYVFSEIQFVWTWTKTSDGGLTWTTPTDDLSRGLFAGVVQFDMYYARWNDPAAPNIVHLYFWNDSGARGLWYSQFDVDTETSTTPIRAVALSASAGGGGGGICLAPSGRIYMSGSGFTSGDKMVYSDDDGVTWALAGASFTLDLNHGYCTMWPDFSTDDDNDVMALYSYGGLAEGVATTLRLLRYDASAGTRSTATIATMYFIAYSSNGIGSALTPDGHIYAAAVTREPPDAGTDISTWDIYGASVTAKTDVLTNNATVHAASMSVLANGDTYVWYQRDPDNVSARVSRTYYNFSFDGMATWEGEVEYGSQSFTTGVSGATTVGAIYETLVDIRPGGSTPLAAYHESFDATVSPEQLWIEAVAVSVRTVPNQANVAVLGRRTVPNQANVAVPAPPVVLICRHGPVDGVQFVKGFVVNSW